MPRFKPIPNPLTSAPKELLGHALHGVEYLAEVDKRRNHMHKARNLERKREKTGMDEPKTKAGKKRIQ